MKEKNKTKKEIEVLYEKIAPLQNRISALEEAELLNMQIPRIRKMVGYCLRSIHEPKSYYGKILDLVEDSNGHLEFILEEVQITKEGSSRVQLNNVSPYLNKEWWDAEIPMYGWKICTEGEYQIFRAKVFNEMSTQNSLRKFIQKGEY